VLEFHDICVQVLHARVAEIKNARLLGCLIRLNMGSAHMHISGREWPSQKRIMLMLKQFLFMLSRKAWSQKERKKEF
jgi:hypothetical protein